jgi:hypothetical protein
VLRNNDETVTRPLTERRPELRLSDVSVSHLEVLDATVVLQHKKFVNLHPDSPRRGPQGRRSCADLKPRVKSHNQMLLFESASIHRPIVPRVLSRRYKWMFREAWGDLPDAVRPQPTESGRPSMIARVATFHRLDTDKLDPAAVEQFRNIMKGTSGYVAGFHLRDPSTGKAVSFVVYESREALEEVGEASRYTPTWTLSESIPMRWTTTPR